MSTDSSQQRLDQAIRLSQLGEKEQSRKILLQLIQENAKNEYAWLWLVDVCDSEKERKAILSRGLKLNPQSKLLKTAMKRFVDTGDLRSITESLDELKAEVAVSIAIDAKREATTPATPFITTSDLDWIELDQEKNEPEQIDTISDDEFTRLSEKFFGSGEMETPGVFSLGETPSSGSDTQSVEPPAEMFELDQFDDDEPEFTPRRDTKENINAQELLKREKEHQGIEDELKGALAESKPQKIQKKRFRLPYWRRISQRLLVILVSAFWLIVFVLAGLFLVQYLNLAPRGEDELALNATDLPTSVLEVDSPSVTETPQPEETGEPTPAVFATLEIIEPEPVYAAIYANNFEQIGNLDTLDHATVAFFTQELDLLALIHPRRIQVLESMGDVLWEFEIPVERPNYLGGTFNKNGSQLAFFTDTMQVEIWSVERGTRLSTYQLSEEQQTIYSNIPYLPANTRVQLAYSEDGNWLAAAFWGGISVWDVRSGEVIHWYALPDNILVSSFNANLDISFVVAFPLSSNRMVYGGRENIFLVDLVEDQVIQNWKTQYVGSLAFTDEDTVIETGYSLGNLPTYLTVWGADEIFPAAKRNSLSSQRGFRLPNYLYFTEDELLVYEVERAPEGSMALEVYSLVENDVINIFDLNTLQPIFAIDNFGDNMLSIWLDQPQEVFGARDTVQLWDIQLGTVVAQCEQCTYPAGRFANSFQLYSRPGQEFIVLQARGVGIQWLGLVSSPVE